MGTTASCRCEQCGLEAAGFVGVGMALTGGELCPCYRCRKMQFVEINVEEEAKMDAYLDGTLPLLCPDCGDSLKSFAAGDPCPVCRTPLAHGKGVDGFIGHWD
jgi:ssDNA-binding Zn-finger/Zn-ribbon topoisomerase 1